MKLFVSIILLSVIQQVLLGQDAHVNFLNRKLNVDTNYIEDLSDMIVVRGFTKSKFNSLEISNTETGDRLVYAPHPTASLGGGFNYHWLGLDVAFQLPESEDRERDYGNSNAFDLQTNMYLRKFSVDLSYVKYGGYFISDQNDSLGIDTIIKRSDIRTHNIGASVNYIFNNKRFSYRAADLQNERQKKSAGTWISGVYFSRTAINSQNGFIPKHYQELYPETKDLIKARSWQVGLQGGYAYTVVLWHFYLTLSGSLGVGYENLKFSNRGNEPVGVAHGVTPKIQFKGALGYNGKKLSIGIQGVRDGLYIGGLSANDVTYNYGSIKLFGAYRINAPKELHIVQKLNPMNVFKKKK